MMSGRSAVIPAMPCYATSRKHRQKVATTTFLLPACIARPVGRKELFSSDAAVGALHKEWGRLRDKGTWDESVVKEWSQVAREARETGRTIHLARLFGICVEKGSELAKNDPRRKYKYRVVFQGNNVTTQSWEIAIFQDLGSSPACMEAGKAADCYGSFPDNACEQADAEQAYVQADLHGTET